MKIIKTETDYDRALNRVEELVTLDPAANTEEAEELDLLTLLINAYEEKVYPIDPPDPVDAIRFRMEQQGLKNSDMIPYFGSKSRVSEVLNRKRGLSLSMIRALNRHLGIPAEVLISEPDSSLPEEIEGMEWTRFPLSEMMKMGWIEFNGSLQAAKEWSEEIIRSFFSSAGVALRQNPVFFRKSLRTDRDMDEYALVTWYARVLIEQKEIVPEIPYNRNVLTGSFFDELRRLSFFNEGPLLAREYLFKLGIKLVAVPRLKGTYLDGAVFFNQDSEPVIAMTLRYDRIDNFWFTLFHELSHLALHFNGSNEYFFDDLKSTKNLSEIEKAADRFAEEHLIPKEKWESFYSTFLSEEDVRDFSNKMRISPAIVAGRIQKERDNYGVFRKMLGQDRVRECFGDQWTVVSG